MYFMMAQTSSFVCSSLGEMNTIDVTNISLKFNPLICYVCIPLLVSRIFRLVIVYQNKKVHDTELILCFFYKQNTLLIRGVQRYSNPYK